MYVCVVLSFVFTVNDSVQSQHASCLNSDGFEKTVSFSFIFPVKITLTEAMIEKVFAYHFHFMVHLRSKHLFSIPSVEMHVFNNR